MEIVEGARPLRATDLVLLVPPEGVDAVGEEASEPPGKAFGLRCNGSEDGQQYGVAAPRGLAGQRHERVGQPATQRGGNEEAFHILFDTERATKS